MTEIHVILDERTSTGRVSDVDAAWPLSKHARATDAGLAARAWAEERAADNEVGDEQRLRQLRGEIAARLGQGDALDAVERELIAPSGLPEEQQSALWLYGWSLLQ